MAIPLMHNLNLSIVYLPVVDLSAAPRNARKHSRKQLRKLGNVMRDLGCVVPILVDRSHRIIAGHGRAEAAKLIGLSELPAIYIEHLTPAQVEALALAENRISDEAGWSTETLTLILQDLATDLDFDLSTTAFDTGEIDLYLMDDDGAGDDDPPSAPPSRATPAVSRPGDVWDIGSHRVICGDAREAQTYAALMGTETAQLSVSDPPYNVRIEGHVSGTGQHAEFPMASGEMTVPEFTQFLRTTAARLVEHGADGSLHFIFMDFRHMRELLDAGEQLFSKLVNLCVWVKRNGGMGSLYRSQHELVFVFKAGTAAHVNNVELGKHGRNRTNVWHNAGANSFGRDRDAMLARHPTSKPVDLIADAILDCSHRGDLILDAFLGSGTTLLAAERTGRRCRGIELDPYYVDMAVERAATLAGKPAVHLGTGLSFAALAHARRNPGWGGTDGQ